MKQSDLFLQSEGDAFYRRNLDKPRLPDPVIEAMQACNLQPKALMELGCGNGWRLAEIEKLWPGVGAVGYDASAEATGPQRVAHVFQADVLDAVSKVRNKFYDTVIFGFCLYLVDREDLMMIAAHTDRVLQDKGHIVIHDNNSEKPYKVKYKHKEGVWAYHWNNAYLWYPSYFVRHKKVFPDGTGIVILQKDIAAGWPERAE